MKPLVLWIVATAVLLALLVTLVVKSDNDKRPMVIAAVAVFAIALGIGFFMLERK
jgi:hypothetical protein